MIMRNLWFVVLPALVLLVITETFARNPLSINEREHNILTLSDVKGKKIKHKVRAPVNEQNLSEDLQGERILIKVNEGNEDDGGRYKRDITELDELQNAKKSYAKLKLAQTQSDMKKWKNKDYGKYLDERTTNKIDKRHANYHNNRKSVNRIKRYVKTRYPLDDKTDYYAQRKAAMETFYNRQKEIEEKHAKKMATIPKYIYRHSLDTKNNTNMIEEKHAEKTATIPNYIYTHSLDTKNNTNNVSSTSKVEETTQETNNVSSTSKVEETTQETNNVFNDLGTNSDLGTPTSIMTTPESVTETTTKIDRNSSRTPQPIRNSPDFLNDEDATDDYEYYDTDDNDNTFDANEWTTDDSMAGTLKWGNCSGKLVYRHNLILNVQNASSSVANLTASFSGPFCITCVRAIPMNPTKANMLFDVAKNENGEVNLVKVSMKGFHTNGLWYITKVWATSKENDVCKKVN